VKALFSIRRMCIRFASETFCYCCKRGMLVDTLLEMHAYIACAVCDALQRTRVLIMVLSSVTAW
jgi:hypothetical protein